MNQEGIEGVSPNNCLDSYIFPPIIRIHKPSERRSACKKLSKNHDIGRALEIPLACALRDSGVENLKHNEFDDYTYPLSEQGGVDAGFDDVRFECKNLNDHDYVGKSWIKEHIVDRFNGLPLRRKFLVISFERLLSRDGVKLLRSHGIRIIEVGFQVSWENMLSAIDILKMKLD